jgi:hypothetical protein
MKKVYFVEFDVDKIKGREGIGFGNVWIDSTLSS